MKFRITGNELNLLNIEFTIITNTITTDVYVFAYQYANT